MQKVSRLIQSFTPAAYNLSLTLNRQERSFHGIVTIQGSSHQDGSLTLHSKDLIIESVQVDGKQASFVQMEHDELDIAQDGLKEDSHTLVIAFSGAITDPMHGLYPCYFEHNGVKKELLATQFESHHAREVFPCIDEPEAKATFDVTLTTEQDVTVLGNMPVKFQRVENDLLVTSFERSPRMSSYLVAWVVGELHKSSVKTKSGVEVNVWGTVAQPVESFSFALDIAKRTIDFFDEYFGVAYPLPKSDHVALPDFSSGAMENWGLITYREIALLANPKTVSVSGKHYIATVIAHELSHQWFGNLVTMKWWNNLWLNESFATLMEYIAIDALEPEWNVWLDFASSESIMALRRDSIDGVQAVQVDVDHPDEISTLFDGAIVYAKGARLLRMLEVFVGKQAFQSGLSAYFKEFAYKNTDADDLWKALSVSSGKDVAELMNAWISQPGYPVVTVTEESVSQQQFFIGEHSNSDRTWPIPLGSNDSDIPELLQSKEASIKASGSLRLNVNDSAHFLTRYSPEHLQRLLSQLETYSPLERLQLLHEQTLLARGGMISSAELIPLLNYYKTETAESVWDIIGLTIGELRKFIESSESAEMALRTLSGDLAQNEYQRLGWDEQENEPETDTKLRASILGMMLYSERQDVLDEAARRFTIEKLEETPAEIRSLLIGTAVRYGDSQLVDHLMNIYTSSTSSDLQQDIISGATSTRDANVANKLLDMSKDSSLVRRQDAFRWYVYLVRNRYSRDVAWEWLQQNWAWVKEAFGGDKSYDDYPRYSASGLLTRKQLNEYIAFFTPMLEEAALARVIKLGINEITARVELIEKDELSVQKALLKK